MGIGAWVSPRRKDAPGGCTRTSAPTPSTRFLLSFTSPVVMPTTSITMPTSTATARMLTAVRIGRCRMFSTISLLSTRALRPALCGAEFQNPLGHGSLCRFLHPAGL